MRRKRNTSRQKSGTPPPGFRRGSGRTESQQRRSRRPDKRVHSLPHRIYIRKLVGKKLHNVKSACNAKDQRMRKYLKAFGEMNDAEALQQAKRCDGCVNIQAGRKTRAKNNAEGCERAHVRERSGVKSRQTSKYHEIACRPTIASRWKYREGNVTWVHYTGGLHAKARPRGCRWLLVPKT